MKDRTVPAVPIAQDGGWGWMVLLGAFVAYFIADGWCYSFGVLYPELLENFSEGKGKTSLIAALLYGVPMILSPIVCALITCYGCRIIAIVGGLCTAASLVVSAYATSVNFLCASIGVLASVGLVMTYLPALLIVTYYFEKRRGLATGLAVAGSGLGSILFPPFMEYLCGIYSWRGFLLITGGLCLHMVLAGCLYRPPPMGYPACEGDSEDAKHLISAQKNGNHAVKGGILVTRMHSQEGARQSQSCTDLSMDSSSSSRCRYQGGSSLSLHLPGRCSGAVAVEIVELYDKPSAVSSPGLYYYSDDRPVQHVADSSKKDPRDPKSCAKVWNELKMIVTTMLDVNLVKNPGFVLFCMANFVLFLWVGVPYVFLIDRAIELDIAPMSNLIFLASIIGIGRTFGQIIVGYLGDHPKVNCNILYAISVVVVGTDTLLVPLCTTYWSLCTYSAVYGLFVSVTYAIQMLCVVEIVGLEQATSGFGAAQLLQGVATILGTPLAGWLHDISGGYNPTFYTAGAWMVLSGLSMLPIPWLIREKSST